MHYVSFYLFFDYVFLDWDVKIGSTYNFFETLQFSSSLWKSTTYFQYQFFIIVIFFYIADLILFILKFTRKNIFELLLRILLLMSFITTLILSCDGTLILVYLMISEMHAPYRLFKLIIKLEFITLNKDSCLLKFMNYWHRGYDLVLYIIAKFLALQFAGHIIFLSALSDWTRLWTNLHLIVTFFIIIESFYKPKNFENLI